VVKDGCGLHLGSISSFLYESGDLSESVHHLNEDAINIFLECDGCSSIDKIIHNLSFKTGEDVDEIKDVVGSFILDNEYLDILDKAESRESFVTGSKDFQVPLHLLVELTDYCNWNCKHCFNDSSSFKHDFIDSTSLIIFLREMASMGCNTINFSGGEPLAHPQFSLILKEASKLFSKVVILSNGTLINSEHISVLKNIKNKITLRLTLNSSTSDFMDDFVGRSGAFNRVNEVISLVSNEGINVEVAMICTPHNYTDMVDVAKLSEKLGSSKLEIGIITSEGRAIDHNDLIFSSDGFSKFEDEFKLLVDEFGDYISKSEEYNARSEDSDVAFHTGNCGVGVRSMSVTPQGDIKLCPINVNNFYRIGNVLDEDFKSVLLKMEKFRFDKIDVPQVTICGGCQHLFFCSNCIVKGFIMHDRIGNECVWGEKYI
jgi:radical SAM protein with 4Fe4S-binding SPASM domain